jgi:hypothetical protein
VAIGRCPKRAGAIDVDAAHHLVFGALTNCPTLDISNQRVALQPEVVLLLRSQTAA